MLYSKKATKFNRKRSFYGDGWWDLTCVVCGDKFDSNQSKPNQCNPNHGFSGHMTRHSCVIFGQNTASIPPSSSLLCHALCLKNSFGPNRSEMDEIQGRSPQA